MMDGKLLGGVALMCVMVFATFSWLDKKAPALSRTDDTPQNATEEIPSAHGIKPAWRREIRIPQSRDGHYYTQIYVDNASIDVLIDTGASILVLRESDARRVGLYVSHTDYTIPMNTANGQTFAARKMARRVELGDLAIEDIEIFILPDDRLRQTLLGMSVLSKAARVEISGGEMIIEADS